MVLHGKDQIDYSLCSGCGKHPGQSEVIAAVDAFLAGDGA